MLYMVSVPEGNVTVLDSVDVLEAHDFSWSPDGRWLAFSRPTELDESEEVVVAADLWIAETGTGRVWPLIESANFVEMNPLWISDRTIQLDRYPGGSEREARQTLVVELSYRGAK
jgi:hypothetical protein